MKKILKPFTFFLLAVLIIIQFFHPKKNISLSSDPMQKDISKLYHVPDTIHSILQTSCYDCHSNNTKYPWYAEIQPVAWWLNNHIREGMRELNFSEFASYRIRRQYKKLEEIINEVKDDEMPLSSYTLIHRNARLNKEQKQELITWANEIRDTIKANYPADSLARK